MNFSHELDRMNHCQPTSQTREIHTSGVLPIPFYLFASEVHTLCDNYGEPCYLGYLAQKFSPIIYKRKSHTYTSII